MVRKNFVAATKSMQCGLQRKSLFRAAGGVLRNESEIACLAAIKQADYLLDVRASVGGQLGQNVRISRFRKGRYLGKHRIPKLGRDLLFDRV